MQPNVFILAAAGVCLASASVGASWAQAPESPAAIRLRNAVIDTRLAAQPARSGTLAAAGKIADDAARPAADGARPYIIQFRGPVRQAWKTAVEQTGARLGGYLPDNAFMVQMTSGQLASAAELECVQWIGAFRPEYKTDPDLGRRFSAARSPGDAQTEAAKLSDETFTVQTFSSAAIPAVSNAVVERGGQVLAAWPAGRRGVLRARMPLAGAAGLAEQPAVEFIEVYVAPGLHNNVATDGGHMNVQAAWTGLHLAGSGQVVGVADTGLDSGDANNIHPDFSNRVVAAFALGRPSGNDWSDSTANGGHGTHVAGSVLGSGAAWSNGLFRGAAPQAGLVFQSVMDEMGSLGGIPANLTNLFYPAYLAGARIHTDSWGSRVFGQYTADSQSADQFMWDVRDMLVLFSAGNSGMDLNGDGVIDSTSIGAPGTAKNILTVGAAESRRPAGSGGYSSYIYGTGSWLPLYSADPIRHDLISTPFDTYEGMAAFSSRGPCLDGRIKPDIVAPGTDIISCRSRMPGAGTLWGTGAGVLANAASNYYTFSGGTSMSTPLAAGAAALARQYLQQHRGHAAPSAALIKAIILNGARSMTPGQYGTGPYREIPAARPNNVEGWGQVDLAATLVPPAGWTNIYYDVTSPAGALTTGREAFYTFIASGTNRLSVTLCWSDYPASLPAAATLVNDLDLTVTTPDGIVCYPNGLANADRINNVEGIDVSPALPGTVQIRVSGYNVPNGPQPYALVIRGAEYVSGPRAARGDFDADGKTDPAAYQDGQFIVAFSGSGYELYGAVMGGVGAIECSADFDGDGRADPAVFDPAAGLLTVLFSSCSYEDGSLAGMGAGGAPAAGDYDGDGKTDPAAYDAAAGRLCVWLSGSGYSVAAASLGGAGRLNACEDYDGDGRDDPAVFDPAGGRWQALLSGNGYAPFDWTTAGGADIVPAPGDYDGDGKADLMVYNPEVGLWLCAYSGQGYAITGAATDFGGPAMTARAGDYDGDGKADPAVYDPVKRAFYAMLSGSGYSVAILNW